MGIRLNAVDSGFRRLEGIIASGRTKAPPVRDGAIGWNTKARAIPGRGPVGRLLGLGDFSALDATGADANALGGAVYKGLDRLQVDVPAAPRDVVRVRDVVSEARTFAANVAYLCHDYSPNYGVSCRPEETDPEGSILEVPKPGRSTGSASGAHAGTRHRQLAEPPVYPEPGLEPRTKPVRRLGITW